jgi:chromosome segregation ATPase
MNEDLHQEIEASKLKSEKMVDTLKAVLEETEVRITELKHDAYEFKRDVVVGAENPRTGKIMAEKVTRFFENKFNSRDVVIEKLKLKNSALKSQVFKIETQLTQKDDIDDSLHYIDFHQLQIENKQFLAKIEERSEELLAMKLTTGKTIVTLNDFKKQLGDETTEYDSLNAQIADKNVLLEKSVLECRQVNQFIRQGRRKADKLKQEVDDAQAMEMPRIEDYITQKKDMYELQVALQTWQKKVAILEMAAKQSRTQLHRAKFGPGGSS